jgi:hypothetical protein
LFVCFALTISAAEQPRELTVITVSGSGYQRGLDHGKQLRERIHKFVALWKETIRARCKRQPDVFIAEFLKRFDFLPAVRQWTPGLLEEVRGIADGSGVAFSDIFALQLLNDELWLNGNAVCRDRCSAIGVRGTPASIVAQNMDLQGWLDSHQIVLKVRDESGFQSLVFSHVGLIGLTGVNQAGIGVVVNALTQLRQQGQGVPVAFVIRGALEHRSYSAAIQFLRRVSHATGQNYIVGAPGDVGSFEASAGGVTEYTPKNPWPVLYHTNHPLASRDFVPGYVPGRETNSIERMHSLATRLANRPTGSLVDSIKDALRARDSSEHPVCRRFAGPANSFTLGSVVFELSRKPVAWVTAGPPDSAEYRRFEFLP